MRTLFEDARRERPRQARRVLTVSELNALVRGLIEDSLAPVWVEGEISNVRRAPSGHVYFTLKDPDAQITAVLFRGSAERLRFRPEDGLKVLARGRVSLYEPRGTYQIIIEDLEPAGLGALQLAFEQLKTRLQAEGLFDAARKRPLPLLPRRVGIVTSPSGAAIRDILRVLARRFARLEIVVAPARVQGEGAAAEIVTAIRDLNRLGGVDVLVVTRGGGSIEDLWPFNEEAVARAIAGSRVPVVSAVGHEIDVTISDLVADLRAPTPSAAAEMVIGSEQEFRDRLAALRARLAAAARLRVAGLRHDLQAAGAERAFAAARARLHDAMQQVDDAAGRLRARIERSGLEARHRLELLAHRLSPAHLSERLAGRRARLASIGRLLEAGVGGRLRQARDAAASLGERLQALSPLAVLGRGYAICRLPGDGAVLKEAARVRPGDDVEVRLHRGRLQCLVKETHDDPQEGI